MADSVTIGVVCSRGVGPDRGGRRRNEDNYLLAQGGEVRYRKGDVERVVEAETWGTLVAVADGMGGHEDGELASTAAVQALSRIFRRGRPADPEDALHRFVLRAHEKLHRAASRHGPVRMGTTLTACWVLDGRAAWVHVGDSRLYHLRGDRFTRLSRDHTQAEFRRRDGRAPRPGMDVLAQNFLYGSRGLGNNGALRVDRGIDTGTLALAPGDRLLLCSDGLSGFVPEARIAHLLQSVPDPQPAASGLLDRALAMGSDDNVTVIVLRVDAVDPAAPDPPEAFDGSDTIVPV